MIAARGLARAYGTHRAIQDVSFDVAPREIVALLGPNGAGKSTLLQILAGILRPDAGSARVAGFELPRQARRVGGAVGYVPQGESLYPELTARETLRLFARLHGARLDARALEERLARVGLAARAQARVGALSGGQRQRLALAASLVHDPAVLLLDEPGTGLDPAARERLGTLLAQARDEGRAVLMSTHSLTEATRVADRVLFLVAGRLEHTLPAAEAPRLASRFRELEEGFA